MQTPLQCALNKSSKGEADEENSNYREKYKRDKDCLDH